MPSFSVIMGKYMNHVTTKAEEEAMECVATILRDGQQLTAYPIYLTKWTLQHSLEVSFLENIIPLPFVTVF